MSNVYKSFNFLGANTATGLRAPSSDADAVRLVDLMQATTTLNNALTTSNAAEVAARNQAIAAINTALGAEITQEVSDRQAAVNTLTQTLQTDMQVLTQGFTPHAPVFCMTVAPIQLTGLSINTAAYSGTLTDGARVLVAGQGGDVNTADPANGIYIAHSGAWTRADDASQNAQIVRSMQVPVINGTDAYENTIYFLVSPTNFSNINIGTTAFQFARWQGNDYTRADGSTLARNGNVYSARLEPTQLQAGANGIQLLPSFQALLQDLGSATGQLPVAQVSGLMAAVQAIALNQFAAPNTDVAFANHKVTGLADPSADQDAVNNRTLNAAIATLTNTINSAVTALQNRDLSVTLSGGTVANGDTTFNVTHNFNSLGVIEKVYDSSTGETVDTDFVRVLNNHNSCQVIFRGQANVPANQYVLLLHKVA